MATVLITQCLQRDFVDPIGPHDPLPNLLHVGHREATRLLGPEPSAGPLAQLIDWAHGLAPDAIDLVHIRDWHDPGDPAQREHLQRFGAHCIKGSNGAQLVLGMDERAGAASNEVIVDSLTLNDLEGTDLVQQLERIRQAHGGAPLRVGVVGVWTEAKVSFLLYDLKTRLGIDELATCSALTASDSRAQHFNALSQHYVSYVHRDLNAANILVDAHHNVWVIDFFHAGPGHVLKDLAKFENDLLYLLTPIEDAPQLLEALAITRALRSVADLRAPLPGLPSEVRSPRLVRAWEVLQVLRRIGGQLCHEDRHPLQLQVALLRYAVHTLSFPEASPLQKQSALAAACSLADQITRTAEAESALRVDWVESELIGAGRLGITLCPGRRDRGRDLATDLARLRSEGVTRLLCLLTDSELNWADVPDLGPRAQAAGLSYRRFPVPDQGTPEVADALELVRWCREATQRGQTVVVTCMGGLGRSGTLAACLLVSAGTAPEAAIAAVRAARGPRALETIAQEDFVVMFASAISGAR